jgi:hypothetical protein
VSVDGVTVGDDRRIHRVGCVRYAVGNGLFGVRSRVTGGVLAFVGGVGAVEGAEVRGQGEWTVDGGLAKVRRVFRGGVSGREVYSLTANGQSGSNSRIR